MALPNKTKIPVGTVLAGKYRVTREIGRGGMATVHEAENIDIGKRVAIKVLAQELTGSSIVVERFLREARAAAAIRSPYICDVYDSGKLPSGQPFLVLELLEGESLYERMTRQRQLDSATTIAVITQVCRGLTKAHAASIVHRDLKPENIFLTKDEEGQMLAKILDFGLAKFYTPTTKEQARLTREGAVFGTPAYMSPEQVRGQGAVDHRADLWALGCITYECFTGKTVWSTDQGVAMTFAQIASSPLPKPARYRPDLPQAFNEWFERTLDRNIAKRFQTAKEFAETLAAAFGRDPSEIRPGPGDGRSDARMDVVALAQAAPPPAPPPAPPAPPAAPVSAKPGPPRPSPAQGAPAAPVQAAPPPAQESPAAFRPAAPPPDYMDEEDGDPTRVLSKRPLLKEIEAAVAGAGLPDAKMERFRRTPDGKIAKVVPQVAPNAPPVPGGPRPQQGQSHGQPPASQRHGHAPSSQRPPPPSQRPAQVSPSQRPGPPASQRPGHPQAQAQAQAPATPRPRAVAGSGAIADHDSELGNPFASSRRRNRIILVVTLVLIVVAVLVFALTTMSPPTPDSGEPSSGAGATPSGTSGSASASASVAAPPTASVAPPPQPPREPPLPDWLSEVRDAQGALLSGDAKAAATKLGQAVTKSNQHAAAQGLVRQAAAAVTTKGACTLTGIARPRTYDISEPSARRVTTTKPSIVATASGALAAWTDSHSGARHAYIARLDSSFALVEGAMDLTPEGGEVGSIELLGFGDKVIAVYTDARAATPGTFARWLGADGKPTAAAVRIAKNAQTSPAVLGAAGRLLGVAWTDGGDRDSEDLFLQKLSMTGLEPEGALLRLTDLAAAGSTKARVVQTSGDSTKDALHFAFEMERKPASFIEYQRIPLGDLGREMSTTGSNREGKAMGSLVLANVDKSKAHAPQIACSPEVCFVVWHGESPAGAQGAAFEGSNGRALWRRKFSQASAYPAVASSPAGGALAAWIEDGKLVVSQLSRSGIGKTGKLGKAQATQSVLSLAPGGAAGQYLAAWLDSESNLLELYAARIKCP